MAFLTDENKKEKQKKGSAWLPWGALALERCY
jgi:hypothetical protein